MPRITTTNRIDTAKGPRREVYLRREARLQELRAWLEETGVQGPRTPAQCGMSYKRLKVLRADRRA